MRWITQHRRRGQGYEKTTRHLEGTLCIADIICWRCFNILRSGLRQNGACSENGTKVLNPDKETCAPGCSSFSARSQTEQHYIFSRQACAGRYGDRLCNGVECRAEKLSGNGRIIEDDGNLSTPGTDVAGFYRRRTPCIGRTEQGQSGTVCHHDEQCNPRAVESGNGCGYAKHCSRG